MYNIISAFLYLVAFSMIMYSSGSWYMAPFVLWFVGFHYTYIHIVRRFMKISGIKDMQEATILQQGFANQVLVHMFLKWPFYWYNKKGE